MKTGRDELMCRRSRFELGHGHCVDCSLESLFHRQRPSPHNTITFTMLFGKPNKNAEGYPDEPSGSPYPLGIKLKKVKSVYKPSGLSGRRLTPVSIT